MSESGTSTSFAKCFMLFMGIIILLEGVVYLGLAIWGITQESCSDQTYNIAQNPFQFAMDLIYFISENCGDPVASLNGQDVILSINWSTSFIITNRMYIFMITYAVVSGLWIVASLMMIASICGAITTLVVNISFLPWFILVLAGSVLDVVATGFFGNDIVNTKSAADTFAYVGVENPESGLTELQNYDAYFKTPAVVMTCISSRVILIWLLNVFGSSFCYSLSRALAKERKTPPVVAVVTTNDVNNRDASAVFIASQARPQSQTIEKAAVTLDEAEQYPVQIRPKPLPIQTPTTVAADRLSANQNQLPGTPDRGTASPMALYATPVAIAAAEKANNPRPVEVERQVSTAAEVAAITYRNTETHPDRLDYPPAQTSSSAVDVRVASVSPELSAVSPLNTRYSSVDSFTQYPANQSQRVSDELRSQLPWSYTSMLTKPPPPQPPRKPQVTIYPQIPEPDYGDDMPKSPPDNTPQSYSRW